VTRVNLLLLAVLVACALSLVTSRHQARRLFVELERAQGEALYRNAADTRKHMEAEYEQARSVMAYLGFFKP